MVPPPGNPPSLRYVLLETVPTISDNDWLSYIRLCNHLTSTDIRCLIGIKKFLWVKFRRAGSMPLRWKFMIPEAGYPGAKGPQWVKSGCSRQEIGCRCFGAAGDGQSDSLPPH